MTVTREIKQAIFAVQPDGSTDFSVVVFETVTPDPFTGTGSLTRAMEPNPMSSEMAAALDPPLLMNDVVAGINDQAVAELAAANARVTELENAAVAQTAGVDAGDLAGK